MEVEIAFGTLKKCPHPLNRGFPLIEVVNTKIMSILPGPEEVSPNEGVPLMEVSQSRGSTVVGDVN